MLQLECNQTFLFANADDIMHFQNVQFLFDRFVVSFVNWLEIVLPGELLCKHCRIEMILDISYRLYLLQNIL